MVDNKAKILIVEDDVFIAKAIITKFKLMDVLVDFSSDGEEALKKIKNNSYKVILLDLLLPNQNGFWLLEQLEADKQLPKSKIIIFSNLSHEEEIQKAKKFTITDYFVKSESSIDEIFKKTLKLLTEGN